MALIREARLAVRHLVKSPGYTIATLATLALAIGATTAIFSAVHAVLLYPTPVRQPGQVVVGWGFDPSRSHGLVELTYRDVEALGAASRSFASVASVGASTWTAVLDGHGESDKLSYAGVSGTFFETLGATPLLGRTIRADDDVPNGPHVIVLSHGTWVRRFGSDPDIVGRQLTLDEESREVVGVMPAGFDYPRGAEYWSPLAPGLAASSAVYKTDALQNIGVLFLVGRLRDGVTLQLAEDDLSDAGRRLDAKRQVPAIGPQVVLTSFPDHTIGPARRGIWALFAAVGVLLLIACANVSGLMLTRVALRQREHAVRLALGATRGAIGRHWVVETVVLAAVGGALGLVIAQWLAAAIVSLAPDGIPRLETVSINLPVAVFAFAVVLVTSLLCGVVPARQAGNLNLLESLGDGGRTIVGTRSMRARSTLLVLQIGLAVVLLVSAGLVARSFTALGRIDLGFDPGRVLTLKVEPRLEQPPANEWTRELLARLAARPGVEAAGAVYLRPLALGPIGHGTWVLLDGQPMAPETTAMNPVLNYQVATPGYFRAMRIRLLRGRLFNDADTARTERVSIVSESTARRLWPDKDAVGQRLLTSAFDTSAGAQNNAWRQVVGVVADVRYRGVDEVQFDLYDPASQSPMHAGDLVIKTAGNPLALAAAVQADARALDSNALVSGITTLDAIVGRAIAPWRFTAWVFSLFALLAFGLAMVGLFSLVSLDVAERRLEFAIRQALGATRGDISARVFRSTLLRTAAGLVLGVTAAAMVTGGLRTLLYGVPLLDWPTYLTVVGLVVLVATSAAYLPVRVAAASDPGSLLRRG